MGRRMRKKEEREECWDEEDRETFYESREGRKPPDPDYRSQAILSFTTGRLRSHTAHRSSCSTSYLHKMNKLHEVTFFIRIR